MKELEIMVKNRGIHDESNSVEIEVIGGKSEEIEYKFFVGNYGVWDTLQDFSDKNRIVWTPKKEGSYNIMVQGKQKKSKKAFDYISRVDYSVLGCQGENTDENIDGNENKILERHTMEILNIKCLTESLLVNSDISFKVEAKFMDQASPLYKFIKINSEGRAICVQDYSANELVTIVEKASGEYKLLCIIKDACSEEAYEDRAIINYKVKCYNPVIIQSFISDVSSPQLKGTPIKLKAEVKGGRELLYRFIISGSETFDSGYIKDSSFPWIPEEKGEYKISLWVKDISYTGDFEAENSVLFTVDEESAEPAKIDRVIIDGRSHYLKNEIIQVKAEASGGIDLKYSFLVYKDGKCSEKIEYGSCNWVNFTPEEAGEYELEVRVKDKYSDKEYDCHEIFHFKVFDFVPAQIDYVILPHKKQYLVGDTVSFETVTQKNKETKIRYILSINGYKVEDTGFVDEKKYIFVPKCSGNYKIELLAKNIESDKEFDSRRIVDIVVDEAEAITNTMIECDKTDLKVNEGVVFSVSCSGGKDVFYEFFLMNKGEWHNVQKYSKKNYYSFMPFKEGNYKLLVLFRSSHKKCSYENYALTEFTVK